MCRVILLIILLFALHSCRPEASLTQQERQAISKAVRQTMHDYYADIRKNGSTAEFKYLDSSADFFWAPPGYSSAISYDSVAAVLKQAAPLFRSIDNQLDTLRIIPLSRELATYTARIHSTMIDTGGKESVISLIETGLFIKRRDGWKLLSGQTAVISR